MIKLSHGKKLGLIAFSVFEIIICLLVIYQGLNLFFGNKILDSNIINSILLSQGTIFTTVWVAKASSNFAGKNQGRE